eukprot:Gb_20087 [translate_table: standard]
MVRSKMGSNKKAKRTGVDFKKIKHKVGRKLPPPKNATKVEVKSKAIILPEQSLALDKEGLAVNRKQQTLKELLMQTTHHNAHVRKDALLGIKDLILRHPKEIELHKLAIIEKLSPRISDSDKGVRETLFLVLKSSIFPRLQEANMGPLLSIIMAHIFNAMTQLAMDIRLMAFKFLALVVQHYQSTIVPNYVVKILQHYAALLGKTSGFAQDKGKLKDILNSLVQYLSSLQSNTEPTDSSYDQGKNVLGTLHGYKSFVPKKIATDGLTNIADDGTCGFFESLQALVPVLLEGWAECAPSVCSVPTPDSTCLDCMVCILQGLSLVFKCARRKEPYDSTEILPEITSSLVHKEVEMQEWVKGILPSLLHRLLPLFPLSPPLHCSNKMLPSHQSSLSVSCKKFSEKCLLSLIPYIPRLISHVTVEWKERLLKAFTRAFTNCNTNSTLKLACLSSMEDMLLHGRRVSLSMDDSGDSVLEVYQRQWIRALPKLLWELSHNNPCASKVVLQVLLHIGRSALLNSALATEYTELQSILMPFFSMHLSTPQSKLKVLYGPFVKLPKDCQELAVDSLYYHSSISSTLLESLARCCLYRELDVSIMVRIIQVLQEAFCRGHTKLADHLSFLLTLIVHCRLITDKPQAYSESSESEQDLPLGFARYKVVTYNVCLCFSEMGDESLVLHLLQPTLSNEMASKPPLDITCALLRVVVVLSSRNMQLPVQLIDMLPQCIADYLIDVAHEYSTKEESQQRNSFCRYYICPCIFLLSRSEKLTSRMFSCLESSSFQGSHFQSEQSRHLCAVSWVVTQIYKHESVHKRLSVCELSTKAILQNINVFQASHSMSMTNEERENLMKFYRQLKVTVGAVHNWKVETIDKAN